MPRTNRAVRLLVPLSLAAGAVVALDAVQRPQFRAGVDLVSLSVTVTGPGGRFISDLTADDFTVLEDGHPQEIVFFDRARSPMAVALLVDTSGSMRRELPLAQQAALAFVERLRPGDVAQVMSFDRRVQVLQEFTDDRPALRRAINGLRVGGSTSLYNAVYVALHIFDSLGVPAEDTVRRDVIVLLSDGADTSSLVELDHVIDAARRSHTAIYSIGLGLTQPRGRMAQTHPTFALRSLAQDTGGRLLEASDGTDLSGVYTQIADELRSQYVIGYNPNNPAAGDGWRRIDVRVSEPGLQARTRTGYYASQARR